MHELLELFHHGKPKGTRDPPMPRGTPKEIAGLIKGLINHWFPLIRPAIRASFLG